MNYDIIQFNPQAGNEIWTTNTSNGGERVNPPPPHTYNAVTSEPFKTLTHNVFHFTCEYISIRLCYRNYHVISRHL